MPIYQKIQKVMQAVHGVEKTSENTHARYKFAGHEAVTSAIRGHFAELGIVRHPTVLFCDLLDNGAVKMMVRIAYVDTEDSSKLEIDMPAIQPPQGKPSAQQVGQALSYAVKNAEFKLFALTGDAEPDTDSLPIDRGERAPPPDWDHPSQRRDHQTAQQAAHGQADAIEDVLIIYDKDTNETEGAATATEAAKALAGRMKAEGYFNASRMLQWNMDWIQHLPRNWQDRLEQIVTGKKEAEGSAAQQHFGKGKVA